MNSIVLLFHGICHSVKVGLPAAIVLVRMVVGDVPGRGGRHECLTGFNSYKRGIEVGYVSVHSVAALPSDRTSAGRLSHTTATAWGS